MKVTLANVHADVDDHALAEHWTRDGNEREKKPCHATSHWQFPLHACNSPYVGRVTNVSVRVRARCSLRRRLSAEPYACCALARAAERSAQICFARASICVWISRLRVE